MCATGACAGVPELSAKAAQVLTLFTGTMIEPRHVNVLAANPAVVPRGRPCERRQITPDVEPDLFRQVTPDHVGPVSNPVRVLRRRGVEQDARRIHAACANDYDFRQYLLLGARLPVEVLNPLGEPLVVHQDSRRDGIRSDLETSG